MDLDNYFVNLMEDLRSKAIANGTTRSLEFLEQSLDSIVDFGDLDDYDIISFEDTQSNSKLIDAFSISLIFNQLTVVVNLFDNSSDDNVSNITNSELRPAIQRARKFIENCLDKTPGELAPERTDLYHFVTQLKNSWGSIKEVKLIFLTNKRLSKRYSHKELGQIKDRKMAVGIWDLLRFYEVESSGTEREDIEIDTSANPLPTLLASSSDQISSYLVVMPATKLAEIYGTFKSRVLEQNVRSFLQNRSNVNKGIRITLEKAPDRFFAYNNGVTATAQELELNKDNQIISLKNLQIVNGGQTTAQIFNAHKSGLDLSNVSVQMKLNIIGEELFDDLVPNIAKFANSQNPVSQADLFSNSPYHVRIEQFSRDIIPPVAVGQAFSERWFYERSRGQYLNEQSDLTPANRTEFQRRHPKNKMITKTDLALVLNSWDMKPFHVSKGAQANFKVFATLIEKMGEDSGAINKPYFYTSISQLIIFREFRKEVPKQVWYSGFPSNIVTYSISWLAHCMLENQLALNIERIWHSQVCPKPLLLMLLSIAEDVNDHILSYAGNPTTYAKSENCWKQLIQNFETMSLEEDGEIFISASKATQIQKDADKEQKALNALSSEVALFSIHPDCWVDIKSFIGARMSPSKNSDIEKLKKGEIIQESKIKPLAKFVREYEKAGGTITYKNLNRYTVS